MKRTEVFVGYSGETAEELLSYPAKGQYDALVAAFEKAIQEKASREGEHALTDEERVVLAVRSLQREVTNGGYDQFFRNSSRKFTPIVVQSLARIGCKQAAKITQMAVDALRLSSLNVKTIEAAMQREREERDRQLDRCDELFYRNPQDIARRLYTFIKGQRSRMKF